MSEGHEHGITMATFSMLGVVASTLSSALSSTLWYAGGFVVLVALLLFLLFVVDLYSYVPFHRAAKRARSLGNVRYKVRLSPDQASANARAHASLSLSLSLSLCGGGGVCVCGGGALG